MNEDRLRRLLRDTPVPGAAEAERHGVRIVNQAYADRRPAARPLLPRLALALAAAALLAALVLSPAGAAVRNWIGDVFTAGVPNAEPALTGVPGGGRLLVQATDGPWVVHPDGSRRLLGRYADAAWSPHGLFVAAASGDTLSAIEPDGTPHWSLSAKARVSDPRWSPSGFRIAYRAGHALRVVAADGTGDKLVDPRVASVPVAWFPPGLHLLAYVDGSGRLRAVDTDTGQAMGSAAAAAGITALSWAADGSTLLETTSRALWLRDVRVRKLADSLGLGPARRIRLPAGTEVRAAAFSPRTRTIAALLQLSRRTGAPRSEVILIDSTDGSVRRLFGVSGRLSDLAWSPSGKRLLLAWLEADQWLFIPLGGVGRIRPIDGIAAAFSPGTPARSPFPQIDGWCCAATPAGVG